MLGKRPSDASMQNEDFTFLRLEGGGVKHVSNIHFESIDLELSAFFCFTKKKSKYSSV